ncbi:hypothetical protein Pint_12995 [Pistacia integerrima]|uniref:Uncharacterized protein n=1 Tax=Pistacia integerrima TaxID=434235 RepID=A0ACC0Y9P4_9ROSI|nr:hypothetical protein Pint_12995 [Pistacia integerrima]
MGLRLDMVWYMIVAVSLIEAAAAADYHLNWTVPPSLDFYSNWSRTTFEVGDAVIFNWTGTHNVADVSKGDYDNCTKVRAVLDSDDPIRVNFSSSGNRYFICTVDSHCEQGQKVAFLIKGTVNNNSSSAPFVTVPASSEVFTFLLTVFLIYNV